MRQLILSTFDGSLFITSAHYNTVLMNKMFSYYEGKLEEFISDSLHTQGSLIKRVISEVSAHLVMDLHNYSIFIDTSWKHTLDNNAVRHIIRSHGSDSELLRGQIPITDRDLLLIPIVLDNYDTISIGRNRRGQEIIIYSMEMNDGVTCYVEELRLGRRELAASTMYKRKKENSPTLMD